MDQMNQPEPSEMKKDNRLAKGRCVGQIRCSRKEQAKRSLGQQRDWLQAFAALNEMEYVTDMKEAVSASQIRKRPDLKRIFDRKRTLNDFDVVIVQDLSRLTRGGVSHGLELFFKFKELGIRLVSLVDGFISGDEMVIKAAQRFQEARAQAKATAMNIRRGIIKSRNEGKIAYTPSVPFGIDRLLSDGKGQPLFRLRLRRDGSQQKWSPDGLTLLHTYPPNAGGERRHHIMQADEFERFIPGDPAIVAIIQRIYREYFVESKSVYAVALGLNDDGIRSPRGKEWAMGSVRKILENSVYLDRATSDRTWVGEFYKNGAKYPLPVVRDEDSQLTQFRPEEEWYHESHPEMGSFLSFDEATKLRIHDWQLERHRRSMLKIGRKRGGNRHKDSRFILTGIIREKYSKTPLSGFCNGKSRYYILSRGMNVPKTANVERRCFNADVVEPAVKPIIQGVLASYDGIRSAVEAAVAANVKAKNEGNSILPALIVERDRILAQLDFWVNQLGDLDESVVTSKIAPLKDTVTDLGIRIESLRRQGLSSEWQQRHDGPSLESVVKSVASSWDNLPNEAIRRILRLLCVIDVDFETGEVEVEVRLPSWLAQSPALLSLCLENNTVDGSIFEAHPQWAISLGKYRFLYKGVYGGIIRLPDDVDRAAA